ncbi:MAG: glycosyltransferase family 61 protein [Alphaproteobacteria bacterium]|nr:glycosyltransferase family 61 protein [Alphaproteobacteria bacterium]
MVRPMARATVEVITPFHYPHLKEMVHQTGSVIRAGGRTHPIELMLHAYIAKLGNVIAAPKYPGLLDPTNNLVVLPHPIDEPQSPRINAFGAVAKTVSDSRVTIAYTPSGQVISEQVVKTLSSGGYGLFILDCVVGAHHAREVLGDGFPMLVPDTLDDRRRFLLGLAGVKPSQFIEVPFSQGTELRNALVVSRVLARDPIYEIGGRPRNLRCLVDPIYTNSFNDVIADRYGGDKPRRIYISRDDATVRRVSNESTLTDRLSEFGFEAHKLGTLDIETSVAMFANAEMIVTPHGSGAFNNLFAPRSATVIEIDHPRNDFVPFGISRSLGQRYRVFNRVPENQRQRSNQDHQTVDVDALSVLVASELDRRQ